MNNYEMLKKILTVVNSFRLAFRFKDFLDGKNDLMTINLDGINYSLTAALNSKHIFGCLLGDASGLGVYEYMQIIIELENEFGVTIDDSEIFNSKTFLDLIVLFRKAKPSLSKIKNANEVDEVDEVDEIDNNKLVEVDEVDEVDNNKLVIEDTGCILYLPSFCGDGTFSLTLGLSEDECVKKIKDFEWDTLKARKIRYHSDYDEDNVAVTRMRFGDSESFDSIGLRDIYKMLVSKIPTYRGIRPIFINLKDKVIGIGTTVIYNINWAAVGVEERNLYERVKEIIDGTDD